MPDYRGLIPGLGNLFSKNEPPPTTPITPEQEGFLFYIFVGVTLMIIPIMWFSNRFYKEKTDHQSSLKPQNEPE